MMGRRHKGWGQLRLAAGRNHKGRKYMACGPYTILVIQKDHEIGNVDWAERKLFRFRRYARMMMRKRREL